MKVKNSTKTVFLSAFQNGRKGKQFHFVYHLDHSWQTNMGMSSKDKEQRITNEDVDNLLDNNYPKVILSSGCHPARFDKDCIAEHFLNKKNGGAVAFIGNTDVGFYDEYVQLDAFISAAFSKNILSKQQYSLGYLHSKTSRTLNPYWRLHLLGDPETPLWAAKPGTLNVTVTPSTIVSGSNEIQVRVRNLPAGQQATICLMKGEEGYATLTVGNTDFHKFSFTPRTSGTLDVTVTAHNFRPYETTIPVNANENPAVYISDLIFDDDRTGGSIGNADGQLDAGETIELAIDVKNSGKVPFNRVIGTLSCASPYISILNSQAEFGGIAANGTAQSQTKFRFRIKEDAPEIRKEDLNAIEFILKIDNGFSDFFCTDAFKIDVFAPELKMSNQFILRTMTPEVLSLSINLMNTGKAQATGLTATLLPDSSCDNVLVGPVVTASYPAIGKYETKSNATTLEFRRKNSSTVNEQLKMKLKVVNEYGKVT